jgi:nucleoside-diphosphate-sugar epimerase
MAVVVTGSAGFIGSHLVEALAGRGHDVVGIDRRAGTPPAAAAEIIADLVADEPSVRGALRSAEAVWHLAGCPGVRDSASDIEHRRRLDNVVAGARVIAATPSSTPLVVVSSSSVYGGAVHEGRLRPSRESDPLRPLGGYARSKTALEHLARHRESLGGNVAIARPFTVAGARQRPDMAFARWIEAARSESPLVILGSSERMRDVTDVRDVVTGLVRIVECNAQGVFNLASGVSRSLTEMAWAVSQVLGVPGARRIEPPGADEVAVTWASIDRARDVLDFEPNTDLVDIVRHQVAAEVLL